MNHYEKLTHRLLTEIAHQHGDSLLAKVRVADAMDLDDWTGDAKHYGLAAHYDFLMVDAATSLPKFAVELDGAQHWNDPATRRRDVLKDQLSEWAGLPLLRITSDFIRQRGRWSVLSYVTDAFYLSEAFYAAQADGHIPMDEPFIATSVVRHDSDGFVRNNSIDSEARVMLKDAAMAGRLADYVPTEFHTRDNESGAAQTHAWLAVAPDRYLVSRVRIRDFRFQGLAPSQLSSQLAVAEIGDLAERWFAGDAAACDSRTLLRYMQAVQCAIDDGGFRGAGYGAGYSDEVGVGGPLPMTIEIRFRRSDAYKGAAKT